VEAVLVDEPSWPSVGLALVNVLQVVLLAWVGQQQILATRERVRRRAREDASDDL
jgi:hypothetical protein